MTRNHTDRDDTRHLLRSPKNAERLLRSIAESEAGKTVTHDLIDPLSPPMAAS